ncbi:MAG: type IV pilin [Methanolinea sp.]
MEREGDAGIDEVIGTVLLVVLVIALVAIIGGIVFGYITLQPKSAYIPPRVAVVDYAGGKAISLYSRGGDPAVLDPSQEGRYVLGFYLDTGRGTFKAVPDTGVATWNPGETIYIYYDAFDDVYRIGSQVPDSLPAPIPDESLYLRVVDERAKLLVLKEGIAGIGGGTVTPTTTPTTPCTLGTGWRIWNRDTVAHTYILRVFPTGPVISSGSIPAKTQRFVWYSQTAPYKGNLTTLENGQSEVRGSGNMVCQFNTYDQPGPSAASQPTLQLNPM